MTKPHEQQDLEAAEKECPGDLHFREECDDLQWKCGANLSWKEGFVKGCRHKEAQLASELAAKDAEIARLREALVWYADPANHEAGFSHDGCATNVNEDNGERARQALSAVGK